MIGETRCNNSSKYLLRFSSLWGKLPMDPAILSSCLPGLNVFFFPSADLSKHFLNISVLFSFKTSCTFEFYISVLLCEMSFFILYVTIMFAIYLMDWKTANSQSFCPYLLLLMFFLQLPFFFFQGKGIYVYLVYSQVETATMLFMILLPLVIFPTLTMELMCSRNPLP